MMDMEPGVPSQEVTLSPGADQRAIVASVAGCFVASFRLPSIWMVYGGSADGPGEGEKTEKITINLGLVDLGQIDLLVQEGFYTNRTDFIRTAIRTSSPPGARRLTRQRPGAPSPWAAVTTPVATWRISATPGR